jgi:C1A family cysteine protease
LNIQKLSNDELTRLNLDQKLSLKLNTKPNKYKQINLTNRIKYKIDLRNQFPPVCDQGALASCTANAFCGLIGYIYNNYIGSRLFLYYNERLLRNNVKFDDGAYLSDGIISLRQNGICPESLWTYNNNFAKRPSMYCYDIALRYKIYKAYNLTNSLYMMKQYLSNGYPFVLGIGLYESFMSKNVALNGIVPMPNTITETYIGGHAVACVGYNNTTGYWIMRNSWGTSWGDNGYFYLPYAYLLDINLCSDIWTITKI